MPALSGCKSVAHFCWNDRDHECHYCPSIGSQTGFLRAAPLFDLHERARNPLYICRRVTCSQAIDGSLQSQIRSESSLFLQSLRDDSPPLVACCLSVLDTESRKLNWMPPAYYLPRQAYRVRYDIQCSAACDGAIHTICAVISCLGRAIVTCDVRLSQGTRAPN